MKNISLINFDVVSVDKIIGLYDNDEHKQLCKASGRKEFRNFLVSLTVLPKKRFEILLPEEFNNGEIIDYDNINHFLHYDTDDVNDRITGIDLVEKIIDGKVRYFARDAEGKQIEIEWHFNDYYDWKTANSIIRSDLVEKNDCPIYFDDTQKFINSLIFRRRWGETKEITWDYSKDIVIKEKEDTNEVQL